MSIISMLTELERTGCRFASIVYRNTKGVKSRYVVNLGVSMENVYKKDLSTLTKLLPKLTDALEIKACNQLIVSINKSLESWKTGEKNTDYTCKDVYYNIVRGLKLHKPTDTLHVVGFINNKTLLDTKCRECGTDVPDNECPACGTIVYKPVKSRPLTIAKKKLSDGLLRSKLRQFRFDVSRFKTFKLNGSTLELSDGR